ncbi:Peroxisome biogenesis protein 22 [Vitis vinifera]|uniref:Peroxisome biogenesis protein 22 n=1 Tax=Vitis vinifera TaxID=29760 RepID=A0A438G891_VITVI|nr:Peroxisome biogenesis protein 22 [Vitis vinifera]
MAAESSKEELVRLIKKFGAYLTVKMSNLFSISLRNLGNPCIALVASLMKTMGQLLDSRSVGALAGFAVAMIFTWRLLRSPSGPQRRQPKRQAPAPSSSGVSSQSTTTLAPSGVCSSSEDSRAQNVIDEFFQPVKPTLGQIVRQKLSEGRKVTCRLLGVILEESSPEELQAKQATVRSSVLEVLLEITKFCDLYLMERVLDDESERKVLLALEDAGVFTSGGLVKDKLKQWPRKLGGFDSWKEWFGPTLNRIEDRQLPIHAAHQVTGPVTLAQVARGWVRIGKVPRFPSSQVRHESVSVAIKQRDFHFNFYLLNQVLFCSTETGRSSFVRQLEPDWHIDTNPEVVSQLARFIKYQLHISPFRPERTASNVFTAPSLEQFFGCV